MCVYCRNRQFFQVTAIIFGLPKKRCINKKADVTNTTLYSTYIEYIKNKKASIINAFSIRYFFNIPNHSPRENCINMQFKLYYKSGNVAREGFQENRFRGPETLLQTLPFFAAIFPGMPEIVIFWRDGSAFSLHIIKDKMSRTPLQYPNKYYNRSRELIHNVKKAEEEAFKTVERYAAQKVNRLNF